MGKIVMARNHYLNYVSKTWVLAKNKKPTRLSGFWWCLQGSNQGHMDFQSIALPSELRHHALNSFGSRFIKSWMNLFAGANIEPFLIYPKQILKKVNSYLRMVKDKL